MWLWNLFSECWQNSIKKNSTQNNSKLKNWISSVNINGYLIIQDFLITVASGKKVKIHETTHLRNLSGRKDFTYAIHFYYYFSFDLWIYPNFILWSIKLSKFKTDNSYFRLFKWHQCFHTRRLFAWNSLDRYPGTIFNNSKNNFWKKLTVYATIVSIMLQTLIKNLLSFNTYIIKIFIVYKMT